MVFQILISYWDVISEIMILKSFNRRNIISNIWKNIDNTIYRNNLSNIFMFHLVTCVPIIRMLHFFFTILCFQVMRIGEKRRRTSRFCILWLTIFFILIHHTHVSWSCTISLLFCFLNGLSNFFVHQKTSSLVRASHL